MIVLALIVFGISSLLGTPVELIPNIEMPMLIVATVYPGAAPRDVESLVTSNIEKAVSTLGGIKNVQSSSAENFSMVILEMEYGTDMEKAHSELKNQLDIYANSLPEDASAPTVMELNINSMTPTIVLSATASGDIDLLQYIKEEVNPEFEKLSGVASVDVSGGASDYIRVQLREEKLSQYGLTMSTLVSLLKNADFSFPAGTIGQGNLDLALRGGVSYDTTESLRSIPITLKTGDVIHFSDVADIYEAAESKSSLSRYNGRENVGITVTKRQSASTLSVTRAVKKMAEQLNTSGQGLNLEVVYDSSTMIQNALDSLGQTLIYGTLLAMAILFLFFGDWRASMIVGTSIPLSLLVTLIAMSVMGFSYNMMSLGGLVIGVGMMVDNSIVVLESYFCSRFENNTPAEAALEGTRAVASSIFGSTLTTVVVFLPIALIQGMSGQLFGQLCFTIVFSLIASLISALTVVPLMYKWLQPREQEHRMVHS
ncbi:MAG: efflux RND transporter permease subunit, partial [Oscillospiraceae bacterium]